MPVYIANKDHAKKKKKAGCQFNQHFLKIIFQQNQIRVCLLLEILQEMDALTDYYKQGWAMGVLWMEAWVGEDVWVSVYG